MAILRRVRARISKSRVPDAFDLEHRVETAKEVSLFQLDVSSPHESAGFGYQPSPVEVCNELFSSLPIRHQDFTFIDVGAGKGRVLLVASGFPFKRLIGVEFARELVDLALENMERAGCRAEVVHVDAAEYSFPLDNLIIYLYNPFGAEILRRVLASLQRIGEHREVYLLYLNPKNDSCVREFAHEMYQRAGAKVYHFGQKGK